VCVEVGVTAYMGEYGCVCRGAGRNRGALHPITHTHTHSPEHTQYLKCEYVVFVRVGVH
jgi:hypothetical protein